MHYTNNVGLSFGLPSGAIAIVICFACTGNGKERYIYISCLTPHMYQQIHITTCVFAYTHINMHTTHVRIYMYTCYTHHTTHIFYYQHSFRSYSLWHCGVLYYLIIRNLVTILISTVISSITLMHDAYTPLIM